jgi:NADPH2:quinone reductase
MKAVVCSEFGDISGLRVLDLPSALPGPRQVVVTNHVAGVNFPDALIVQGKYQFRPTPPFVPGSELAGVVKQAGSDVHEVKEGDKVVALMTVGAFAQEVLVDVEKLTLLPADLDAETLQVAGSFMLTYGTSLHALKDRAAVKAGETLLVLGAAGGVGLAAVELGKQLGLRVIAAASSDEKLAVAHRYGADETIDYARLDLREQLKRLTDGRGVDVVYDPVGGTLADTALRCVAWNGRYLVVGFAGGEIPRIALNLPLLKGCSIVGTYWGEFCRREPQSYAQNSRQLLDWLQQGRIRPHISARYALTEVQQALQSLLSRKVIGKSVILPQALS